MTDAIVFLAPAFALCIVVASLHVYLGMHVLAREVIFVDLAVAQLAALGATMVAVWFGAEEGVAPMAGGVAVALGGAALFSVAGRARERLSIEAVVGIVYAVATAAMVLVLSRSPHGAEDMNAALTGSLLFALWSDVAVVAAVFAPLGVLQWVFRRRFVALSWGAHGQRRSDWSSTRWDFVFYALFALAITVSVQAVGVLLVFSFLIVPGVLTQLFSRDLGARLLAGWGVAAAASLAGLTASWTLDLPAGPSIVVAFGALLVVAALVAVVRPRRA